MNSVTKVIITSAALLLAACGPSKEQLARIELLAQEQARIAAEAAQQEASARKMRISTRLQRADIHWKSKAYLSEENVQSLFSSQVLRIAGLTEEELEQQNTYFINYPLQAARYNYKKGFHPFNIVGIRSLGNSGPYSSLFPDEAADYAPGHSAKSVVEFTLHQDL